MTGDQTGRISLKIDLSAGTIEIDAPATEFQQTVDKAKELLGQIPASASSPHPAAPVAETGTKLGNSEASETGRPKIKAVRSAGGSRGRPGRIGSFEPVDLGLSEKHERELRAFMEAKSPAEQAEQVAVALRKGEQILGRKAFAYNEIYTLLHLSGIRNLPKALDVILGRMMDNQWVVREGQGLFALKFVGRDHVEHKLGARE